MRIIFPDQEQITRYGRLRPVVFGDENIVNFFKGVVDGDELYEALQGKNLFYVLEFVGKADTGSGLRGRPTPVYKIGVSHGGDATRRLKSYYNSFGEAGKGRPCEGVTVRFLCGTQHKSTSRATFGGFAIDKMEKYLKNLFKNSDSILRASEWIQTDELTLRTEIARYLKSKAHTDDQLPARVGNRSGPNTRS